METFKCKHCEYPIGRCDESVLVIGGVSFVDLTSMKCPKCRRMNKWRPSQVKISLRLPENRVIGCET